MKVTFTPTGVQISVGVGYGGVVEFILASLGYGTLTLVVSASLAWLHANW